MASRWLPKLPVRIWPPLRNLQVMSLFFICATERLEWCHLHSSVFRLTLLPSPWRDLKKKKITPWLMDLLPVWTSVFPFIVLGRKRSGYSVTGFHKSMYLPRLETSLRSEPQRFVISRLSIREALTVFWAARRERFGPWNPTRRQIWDHYSPRQI